MKIALTKARALSTPGLDWMISRALETKTLGAVVLVWREQIPTTVRWKLSERHDPEMNLVFAKLRPFKHKIPSSHASAS